MSVEKAVESGGRPRRPPTGGLELRLLGPLSLLRDGAEVALPSSRKVLALLAYLAVAKAPVGRTQLCEMLWDVPNDPRGELRWCLSKIRGLVDDSGRKRLHAKRDGVSLDLSDCIVDATQILGATGETTRKSADTLGLDDLRVLTGLFRGDLLDGLEIDRCPVFTAWLVAERLNAYLAWLGLLALLTAALAVLAARARLRRHLPAARLPDP